MPAWYGIVFEHAYVPSFDPTQLNLTWQEMPFGLLWDSTTNNSNSQWAALIAMMAAQADERLSRVPSQKNAVTQLITPGINTIKAPYPAQLQIKLTIEESFFNTWYKNDDLRKMGYFNLTNLNERSEPFWVNGVLTDFTFHSQWGDGVEIVLAQGASGSATVFPWAGIPPSFYENDFAPGPTEYSTGWYWQGPTSWDPAFLEPTEV